MIFLSIFFLLAILDNVKLIYRGYFKETKTIIYDDDDVLYGILSLMAIGYIIELLQGIV